MGALGILKVLCCIFIVTTNILSILIGLLLLLLGCLFTWGFAVLSSTAGSFLTSMFSTATGTLETNYGVSIDFGGLFSNIVQITGSMGACFLVLGIILIVIGCIGCCGACCSQKTCLIIYAVAVGVIFLAQLIIVIIWFSDSEVVTRAAKNAMVDSVKKFTGIKSTNIHSLLQNLVQIFVGCCGVTNGTDFAMYSSNWDRRYTINASGYSYTFNLTYPVTCCKFDISTFEIKDKYCPYNNTNSDTSWYQVGCYNKLFTLLRGYFNLDIIFYILGGFLGVQLTLALGAVLIIMAVTQENKVKPQ